LISAGAASWASGFSPAWIDAVESQRALSYATMSPGKRPPEPRALTSSTAERLAAIVEAAESAASKVIDDAEEQARRQLTEASARADRIVAERLRALADELDPPAAPRRESHLRPVELTPESEAVPGRRSGSAGARLLATQMAVSGASRGEIEQRLRSGFEIEDTSEILDAILGPEE
jgi:cell division septum initiation protein DivIVA